MDISGNEFNGNVSIWLQNVPFNVSGELKIERMNGMSRLQQGKSIIGNTKLIFQNLVILDWARLSSVSPTH